jgi:rod shape-determining protein MreD
MRHQIEWLSWRLMPCFATIVLLLVAGLRIAIVGPNGIMPDLPLISVYYWWIFLPGALPYWFLFLIGLAEDTLSGLPLGVTSLVNMSFVFLLTAERHVFGKMLFGSVWIGFVLLSLIAFALQWLLVSLVTVTAQPAGGALFQWGVTCCAYPVMHWLLGRLQSTVSAP